MNINVMTRDPLEHIKAEHQVAPTDRMLTGSVEIDEEDEDEEREYRVRVTRRVEILEEGYVYIHARSEDEAEERVNDDIYGHCDDWDYYDTVTSYDEEVDTVEEV